MLVFRFTILLLDRGSSFYVGNVLRVTVFLQFSKQLSEPVNLFVSKSTLKSAK